MIWIDEKLKLHEIGSRPQNNDNSSKNLQETIEFEVITISDNDSERNDFSETKPVEGNECSLDDTSENKVDCEEKQEWENDSSEVDDDCCSEFSWFNEHYPNSSRSNYDHDLMSCNVRSGQKFVNPNR